MKLEKNLVHGVRVLLTLVGVAVFSRNPLLSLLAIAAGLHPLTSTLLLALVVVPPSPILGAVLIAAVYSLEYVSRDPRPAVIAAAAGFTGVMAGYYTLLVYRVIVSPPGAPLILREALAKLYSSYTLRYAAALAALVPMVYVYFRAARLASDALASPRAARLLIREWLRREAERVAKLQAWYHRMLFYGVGALIAFPLSILTSALIAVIYSGLALVVPPSHRWVVEALGVVRGVISLFLFAVLDYIIAGWARDMLAYRRVVKPSRLPLLGTLVVLVFSATLALLLEPGSLLYALNPLAPQPPPTVFDREAGRVLNMLALRIEMSEKALRALVEFLWGG